MEEQKPVQKMDMTSQDPENYKNLLNNTSISENNNFLQKTEYRDKYDGTRLYNRQGPSQVYVSKRAGDESDFWAGGKFCYDDPILRKELIYLPNNRESYCKKEIPQQFQNKNIIGLLREFRNILMLCIMEVYSKILNFCLAKFILFLK